MPEYLYPGVYVEEIDAVTKTIPGVSPSIGDDAALAAGADASRQQCSGLKRPAFFPGQLLDAATLTAEQDYHREKLRRHNRNLLGSGVVYGLTVRIETDDEGSTRVVVEPGLAIDSRGEELLLSRGATLSTPAQESAAFITLRFWERACPSDPAAVEEACVIGIHTGIAEPALLLARVVRGDDGWLVDESFEARRVSFPRSDRG